MTAKLNDKLLEILARKDAEVQALLPQQTDLRRAALLRNDFRGFRRTLDRPGEPTVIAEVKKASPSAGLIAPDFDPVRQAHLYKAAGAHALSVLTDELFFRGHLDHLRQVREAVDLPILRKDFTVHPVQIYEAAAAGADAILLIVAALDDDTLARLFDIARTCQLDALVEVHNLEEMDRALDLGADLIGINNRNLRTFEVDLQTSLNLAQEIPSDVLGVAESGIKTRDDIRALQQEGIYCYLIGETLMRSGEPGSTLRDLVGPMRTAVN
ncbi:MAG: indole-3-glycerol phosphate synthase TrpC [Candidatus Methylacidiphilales bacterium]